MPRSLLPEHRNGAYLTRNCNFESISSTSESCANVRTICPFGVRQTAVLRKDEGGRP